MTDPRQVWSELRRNFLLKLYRDLGGEAFRRSLFLSFLGARICYADTPPLSLFAEERFRDPEKLRAFFLRLKASGHASVFAHSPLTVKPKELSADLLSALYKAWYDPATGALQLNLRHFAEGLTDEEFETLIAPGIEDRGFTEFPALRWEGWPLKRVYAGPLSGLLPRFERPEPEEGLFSLPAVTAIELPGEEPFGWLAVIVEGFSRLFSHQFVRHTWLNFNQRSHRYTSVDQFVLPPSFEAHREVYASEIRRAMEAYRRLVESGIRREDARFITPQGAATTVLATGPLFVWRDFVEKRAHPKAQWEIRHLAETLREVL